MIIYFSWLVVFTFTMIAVWRSDRRWFRFVCFWINQLFSVGIILSWSLTSLLAYTFWQYSVATIAATAALSLVLFRRRVEEEIAL